MVRARPTRKWPAIALGCIAALLLVAHSRPALAQDAQGNAFNIQLFRPAVDSKGYFTVNASQILGHLDFSVGLIATYSRYPLNLGPENGNHFHVSDLVTPQVQAALGLFKWVELGFSLPVQILFGERSPHFKSPDGNPNFSSDLTFGAQFIGDVGLHVKGRFLNTSKHPVGLGMLASVYFPSGKGNQFLGEGQFTIRPEIILDKEFGFARRFRMALNLGALIRPSKNTFTDRGTVVDRVPVVNAGTPFCQPGPGPLTPAGPNMFTGAPIYSPGCGSGDSRSLGTQLTYSLRVSGAVVPQQVDLLAALYR